MEETSEEKRKLNLYLIFAGIIVLVFLIIGYYQFFGPSPIPDEFFSKYQNQDTLTKKALAATVYDYGSISKAIQSQNASEAAAFAKYDLVQSIKNQEDMDTVQKTTTQMKLLLGQISDSSLRDKVTSLFGQMDERNTRMHALIDSQTNTFTVLRDHYGAQAVGLKGPEIPQNIDKVIQSSQAEIQSIMALQTTIDVAYQDIIKVAGVDTTVSQTVDTIKMNLSATPDQQPTITDFPTPTPSPTLEPTATPVASSSADEASASAH